MTSWLLNSVGALRSELSMVSTTSRTLMSAVGMVTPSRSYESYSRRPSM